MISVLRANGGIDALARQMDYSHARAFDEVQAALPQILGAMRGLPGGVGALIAVLGEFGGDALASAIMGSDPVDDALGAALMERLGLNWPAGEGSRLPRLLVMLVGGYLYVRAVTGKLTPQQFSDLLDWPGRDLAPKIPE
jgi:hypothetical protein